MKRVVAVLAFALAVVPASATVYNDTQGDVFTNAGGGILDILSLEVTNDLNNINFTLTLAGDVVATDWGKYMLIFDTAVGGNTTTNGWCRPINMTNGAEYWIGSWVDGGNGAELYSWTDGAGAFCGGWYRPEATYDPPPNNDITISKFGNTVSISTPLSNLGLVPGQIIFLDAFSSGGGGGDGAIDSLGNPVQQVGDWGQPSSAFPVTYQVVPEPASVAIVALGALALLRRRR